jgi:hypothetical protein
VAANFVQKTFSKAYFRRFAQLNATHVPEVAFTSAKLHSLFHSTSKSSGLPFS